MEVMMSPVDVRMEMPSSPIAFSLPNCSSPSYTSAPSSPCREAAIYRHRPDATIPVIPFNWEERPGLPKSHHRSHSNGMPIDAEETRKRAEAESELEDDSFEFAFEFSGLAVGDSTEYDVADELFDSGRIRPLNLIGGSFSGSNRHEMKHDEEPIAVEMEKAERGRNRTIPLDSGSRKRAGRRTTRSLPPLGRAAATDLIEIRDATVTITSTPAGANTTGAGAFYGNPNVSGITTTVATITGYVKGGIRKWGLKNLLLFRSASEGRASGAKAKFPGMASSVLLLDQDVKRGSFRSVDGVCRRVTTGSSARHAPSQEMVLYAKSRAMDQELRKRRTFLPYKQGLLSFNPSFRSVSLALGSRPSY